MIDDPIIEELRKHKAELAEEYNNDFWLLAEALNEEAKKSGCKIVNPGPRRILDKTGT